MLVLNQVSSVRVSHDVHQLVVVVRAPTIDRGAVACPGLPAHLGCQVELDGRLADVEVALTEEAEDQGLVLCKSRDVTGAEAEIREHSGQPLNDNLMVLGSILRKG